MLLVQSPAAASCVRLLTRVQPMCTDAQRQIGRASRSQGGGVRTRRGTAIATGRLRRSPLLSCWAAGVAQHIVPGGCRRTPTTSGVSSSARQRRASRSAKSECVTMRNARARLRSPGEGSAICATRSLHRRSTSVSRRPNTKSAWSITSPSSTPSEHSRPINWRSHRTSTSRSARAFI
jgi:hypothetical protein